MNALRAGLVKICMRTYDGGNVYYGESIVSGTYVPDGDAFSISFNACGYDASRADPVIMWQGVVVVGTNYIVAANNRNLLSNRYFLHIKKVITGLFRG
jgi:hypothetical protein